MYFASIEALIIYPEKLGENKNKFRLINFMMIDVY